MRKFVSSMILSLVITLLSVSVIFLLQAPLLSFVYYGFFSNNDISIANILIKLADKDSLTLIIVVAQIVLTLSFIFCLFFFITKVIDVFLKNEKLIRPYYISFFFCTTVIPVTSTLLSIFLKIKLSILTIIIVFLFNALITVLIVFEKKILPETTDEEYRKYLFTVGTKNE